MKTLFRLLACAGLSLAAASLSFAAHGPQQWQTLRTEAQFKALKTGDKIVYVCNHCQTVSEVTIDSTMHAMEHCKEGGSVSCSMCKKKVKIVTKGPPKNPSIERQVSYVNEKGEECMFVAKVTDKK